LSFEVSSPRALSAPCRSYNKNAQQRKLIAEYIEPTNFSMCLYSTYSISAPFLNNHGKVVERVTYPICSRSWLHDQAYG
jgi:hypothetical protein